MYFICAHDPHYNPHQLMKRLCKSSTLYFNVEYLSDIKIRKSVGSSTLLRFGRNSDLSPLGGTMIFRLNKAGYELQAFEAIRET
jgi:hypothetical protein